MPNPTATALPQDLQFATARLLVRPVRAADLADLMAVNGDPAVTRFLPYATWQSADDGVAWLGRMAALAAGGGAVQLVLVLQATQQVVGTLLVFRHEALHGRLEIGYVLARQAWQQGLMQEALRGLCGHAFGALGLRRLEAEVHPDNNASQALLLRLGFQLEGRLRQRWVGRHGLAYDTLLFGLLADGLLADGLLAGGLPAHDQADVPPAAQPAPAAG